MLKRYEVLARDSRSANVPVTGLNPHWVFLVDLDTGERFAPQELPAFRELGGGQYDFAIRVSKGQRLSGQVDLGPGLVDGWDRFVDVWIDGSRFTNNAGRAITCNGDYD